MVEEDVIKNTGLRGVTVADTKISYIDGKQGILIYRGYRIEDLARHSTFEETSYLILKGVLPTLSQLNDFKNKLVSYSVIPDYLADSMKQWPKDAGPMQALMAAISITGFADKDADNVSPEAYEDKAVKLIAVMAVTMVAWERIRQGLEPIPYSKDLSHAENILFISFMI